MGDYLHYLKDRSVPLPEREEVQKERALHLGWNTALNYRKNPLYIVRGSGQYLYDDKGAAYLDCVNNVSHVGHGEPSVVEAAHAQLSTLQTNCRYLHPATVEYSKRLTALMPEPLSVVFWVNSGSEANDLALRLARAHTRKRGVITVGGAYHGHVTSIIDISPYKFRHEGGTGRRRWVKEAPIPDVYAGLHRGALDDDAMGAAYAGEVSTVLEAFAKAEKREAARKAAREAAVKARRAARASAAAGGASPVEPGSHHSGGGEGAPRYEGQHPYLDTDDELDEDGSSPLPEHDDDGLSGGCGAFIMESVLSCGGQVVPPAGYLRRVYKAVRAAGGVCIADEVQIGFGRVGSHFWGFQLQGEDVVPDIVTMGKPMGNGFPVAAVVTTPAIAASFNNGMEYFNTYGGSPLAGAVALAVLDAIQSRGLQAKAAVTGKALVAGFSRLMARFGVIGSVRGAGMMVGIEVVKPDPATGTAPLCGPVEGEVDAVALAATRPHQPWSEAAYALVYAMRARRILLSVDGMDENIIKLKPPMVFNETDAAHVITTLGDVLGAFDEHLAAYRKLSAAAAEKEAAFEAERAAAAAKTAAALTKA